jgi:hypothetical protein
MIRHGAATRPSAGKVMGDKGMQAAGKIDNAKGAQFIKSLATRGRDEARQGIITEALNSQVFLDPSTRPHP